MNRAVIFDVDGVLVDSYQAHFASWRQLAKEHNYDLTEAEFAASFGRTSREVIEGIWNNLPGNEIQVRDNRKEALFRDIIADNLPEMPGARQLWADLLANGFQIGVGSSGPLENVHLVMDHLDPAKTAGAVITGADVARGKPDPQVFLLAASRLAVPPNRCVVVEDAPAGITAAHAAGMKCVALVSTGRSTEELSAADRVIKRLEDISAARILELIES